MHHAHTRTQSAYGRSGAWQQSECWVPACSPEWLTSVTHLYKRSEGGRTACEEEESSSSDREGTESEGWMDEEAPRQKAAAAVYTASQLVRRSDSNNLRSVIQKQKQTEDVNRKHMAAVAAAG